MPPDRVFTPDEPSTWPLTNRLPRAACRLARTQSRSHCLRLLTITQQPHRLRA